MGVHVDRHGSEHIYFAEPTTRRMMLVFDSDGVLEYEVPLDTALTSLPEIQGIAMAGLDSILLSAPYTGEVVRIDHTGKVHEYYDPRKYFTDNSGSFEVGTSGKGDFRIGDCWLFRTDWWFKDLELQRSEGELSDSAFLYQYQIRKRDAPIMAKACPDGVGTRLQLGPDSFYTKLLGTEQVYEQFDFFNHCRTPAGSFYFSVFRPFLFRINERTLEFDTVVTIGSRYTSIGYRPPTVAEVLHDDRAFSRSMDEAAFITQLSYCRPTGHYVVQVLHAGVAGGDWYDRSFSIIVLDRLFRPLQEYVFSGKEHVANVLLSTNKGILVPRRTEHPSRTMTHIFDCYAL